MLYSRNGSLIKKGRGEWFKLAEKKAMVIYLITFYTHGEQKSISGPQNMLTLERNKNRGSHQQISLLSARTGI